MRRTGSNVGHISRCRAVERPRRLARAGLPVVVPAVPVAEGQGMDVDAVETVEIDRHEVAAELGEISLAEALHAAVLAEVTRRYFAAPRVAAQLGFTGEEREFGRLALCARPHCLRTDRTVAAR